MPLYDTKPLEAYLETLGLSKWGSTFQLNVPILGYTLPKDVKEHSFWEVDTDSFHKDVSEAFKVGNLFIKHAFHPITLIMAKDIFERYIKHPQTVIFKNYSTWSNLERKIEEEYQNRSDKVEESGTLAPGFIFKSGVADGHAQYIVTKVTKASVFFEHLHFGDGYRDTAIESFDGKMPRKQFDRISFFGRNLAFRKAFG